MKKERSGFINPKTANIIVAAIYLLSSIIYLNVLESSIVTNSIGIAFIIAFAYGVVCIYKNKKFLF